MRTDKLNGTQRAAILLMCLGEETAAKVFDELTDAEIFEITGSMATIQHIPLSVKNAIVQQFIEDQQHSSGLFIEGKEFAKSTISATRSIERTASLLHHHVTETESKPFSLVSSMKPSLVATILEAEHPQSIALILSTQEPDHAAAIVTHLPETLQTEVIYRIATLESVSTEIIDALESYLETEIGIQASEPQRKIDGLEKASHMLSKMRHELHTTILVRLEETDGKVTQELRRNMLTFEALADLDDRLLQAILRQISSDALSLALTTASDDLKRRFFANMSTRAAEMIRDDLKTLGSVSLNEVEAMQLSIVNAAMKLKENGTIQADNSDETSVS